MTLTRSQLVGSLLAIATGSLQVGGYATRGTQSLARSRFEPIETAAHGHLVACISSHLCVRLALGRDIRMPGPLAAIEESASHAR